MKAKQKGILLFTALLMGFTALGQAKKAAHPNVIIINMDDMGYGDTEPYGMTGIATPNFNKAAQQGCALRTSMLHKQYVAHQGQHC